jgi:hypothetical protein
MDKKKEINFPSSRPTSSSVSLLKISPRVEQHVDADTLARAPLSAPALEY